MIGSIRSSRRFLADDGQIRGRGEARLQGFGLGGIDCVEELLDEVLDCGDVAVMHLDFGHVRIKSSNRLEQALLDVRYAHVLRSDKIPTPMS